MNAADLKPDHEHSDWCGPDQFLVNHGKSGVLGVFTAAEAISLPRGRRVIVRTRRGVEIGTMLGPATFRQASLFGSASRGELLRPANTEDDARRAELTSRAQELFGVARTLADRLALPLAILDVDLLFDGQNAFVQFVGQSDDADRLAAALEAQFRLTVRLENLAAPAEAEHHEDEPGCGKPDCGRTSEGGGCTSCASGGGCSTCGAGGVDLRAYFAHLRGQMEANRRIPLA